MSLDTVFQQNDIGITLIIEVLQQDGETPQDISPATALNIYLTQPNMSLITCAANFVSSGNDGQMYYISQSGDLGQVGIYKIQGSYNVGPDILYTQKTNFLVEPNF